MLQYVRGYLDNFTLALIAVVVSASLFPAQGTFASAFDWIAKGAVGLLFFLHGAKLSRSAIMAGAMHWKLHLLVFSFTFIIFPLTAWVLGPLLEPALGKPLYIGIVFLCALPGTVQSAIAFTSIARGNVPAAICSASSSSLLGIAATPAILHLLLEVDGAAVESGNAVLKISAQLLLPFLAGQAARPWIGNWVSRNRARLVLVDQGSILLVVYSGFSASIVAGLWNTLPLEAVAILFVVCISLLVLALSLAKRLAGWFGFNKEDEITIVFCGSKKSMATGVPMAQVLFSGGALGPALLPLIVFHQIQLMVCARLAQRYAKRKEQLA